MPPRVLAIFGPTAVGKTAVAVATAEELRARGVEPVAISVDALQVYREVPLLTAQPNAAELNALPHALTGHLSVTQSWSVAEHAPAAHRLIDAALAAGRVPIVVGGTGLYLRAALSSLALAPPPAPGVREELIARAAEPAGLERLYDELLERDPASAALMDPADTTRVVRAHELLAAGRSFASQQRGELWTAALRHPTDLVGLTMPRDALRARAAERLEQMVTRGVIDEVRAADRLGPSATARAAVGYSELLAGDVATAVTRTRQLAKRQETWMRRLQGITTVDVSTQPVDEIARALADHATRPAAESR